MAKYQQYDEYKDSGVEWLGEIPKDWKAIKVKYIADTVSTGGTPKDLSSFTLEPEVCWFTPGDFHDGQILRQANKYVTWKSVNTNDAKIYKENSVLVIGIGATLGKVAHCSIPFSCNQQINVITPNSNISSFFLMYSLLVQDEQMSLSSNASTIGIMNQEKTKDILLALPSLKEQKTVTNFLDYETAQIDTLIDKQKTLIKLLKEKRQAAISHAVTKGLNPDAPMKESGVEWLGEVPEHWVVQSIKYAFESLNFRRIPLSSEIRGERKGSFRYYGASGVIDYVDDYIFDEPTVLVGEDGANLVSRNTPLAFSAHGKYWVNNHAHILRPKDAFADYWAEVIEHIDVNPIVSGSAQPKLTAEALSNLIIAFPPDTEERAQIDTYIKKRKEKYGDLIKKAEQAIQLMQERRTALISAAVTGKIDVRGWVAPE